MNAPLLAFGVPGATEFVALAAVILLLFAAKKLYFLSRSVEKSEREYQKAREEFENKSSRPKENIIDARFLIREPEAKRRIPWSCLPLLIMAPR